MNAPVEMNKKQDWMTHPIFKSLSKIEAALENIAQIETELHKARRDAENHVRDGLNAYFAACESADVAPQYRIAMLAEKELVINEDWFDMKPLNAASLRRTPPNVATIIRQLIAAEDGEQS